jgi:hypothetical protein
MGFQNLRKIPFEMALPFFAWKSWGTIMRGALAMQALGDCLSSNSIFLLVSYVSVNLIGFPKRMAFGIVCF